MIKFRGRKHLHPQHLDYVKDVTYYTLNKFFSLKQIEALDVTFKFVRGFFSKTECYAECVWEDSPIKPKHFTIKVDPDQEINMLLNTIVHELIHVKQWAKGELYQYEKPFDNWHFNKARINTKTTDYWDLPWEIEAYGRSVSIVVQWAQDRKLDNWADLIVNDDSRLTRRLSKIPDSTDDNSYEPSNWLTL